MGFAVFNNQVYMPARGATWEIFHLRVWNKSRVVRTRTSRWECPNFNHLTSSGLPHQKVLPFVGDIYMLCHQIADVNIRVQLDHD